MKLLCTRCGRSPRRSRPSRARGLKSRHRRGKSVHSVVPIAGAWIEMQINTKSNAPFEVAPLAGAWIEIYAGKAMRAKGVVAPLRGAWIEIRLPM